MRHDTDMNRRRLLALCGGLAGGALLPAVASAQQKRAQPVSGTRPVRAPVPAAVAAGRRFFSPAAFALLDEIAEAIIPTDENSGGARAAKVAEFIDTRLGESLDGDMQQSWRDDLAEINRLALEMFGKSFVAASPNERQRLLERISRNEKAPQSPGEHAFGTIKWQVSFVYYKTKIGIHDELKYQGNTILDAFVGYEPVKP